MNQRNILNQPLANFALAASACTAAGIWGGGAG